MKKLLLSVLLATVMFGGAAVEVTASANAKTEHTTKHHAKKKARKVAKKHVVKKVASKKATKTKEPKVKELAPKGVTPKGYQPHQVRHLYGNVWEDVTDHTRAKEIKGSMYDIGKPKGRDWKDAKRAKDGRYYVNTDGGRAYIGAGGEVEW
ncbi:hypothetical protein [Apilactobacillus kunkeei]|uniref:Uncharacterized protein n=1 Tax=Apilactobacillus kunkeei TaxID=148814 RepID=A0A1L8CIE7_9LACO|nr:hypothetical protein [Apilactobacillus kunkeei]GAT90978.1 hypothetical protein FF306_01098 [Apilactobacillus kunkeei]